MVKSWKMKKAYLKTLESFLAIFGTFLFIIFVLPDKPQSVSSDVNINLLTILTQNDDFRDCVIQENYTCTDDFIRDNFNSGYYNYTFNITGDFDTFATINRDDVFVKTIFIAGNTSQYTPKIFRFYYWTE